MLQFLLSSATLGEILSSESTDGYTRTCTDDIEIFGILPSTLTHQQPHVVAATWSEASIVADVFDTFEIGTYVVVSALLNRRNDVRIGYSR